MNDLVKELTGKILRLKGIENEAIKVAGTCKTHDELYEKMLALNTEKWEILDSIEDPAEESVEPTA